jgi:hypothetical protein
MNARSNAAAGARVRAAGDYRAKKGRPSRMRKGGRSFWRSSRAGEATRWRVEFAARDGVT